MSVIFLRPRRHMNGLVRPMAFFLLEVSMAFCFGRPFHPEADEAQDRCSKVERVSCGVNAGGGAGVGPIRTCRRCEARRRETRGGIPGLFSRGSASGHHRDDVADALFPRRISRCRIQRRKSKSVSHHALDRPVRKGFEVGSSAAISDEENKLRLSNGGNSNSSIRESSSSVVFVMDIKYVEVKHISAIAWVP